MLAKIDLAEKHVRDILTLAIKHSLQQTALVVYDTACPLAQGLTEAYRRCLPQASFIDFDTTSPADVLAAFKTLAPHDLVVLIQSTNFRLKDFRIRVELFQQSLKVIEHPHLIRMTASQEMNYIESLAYDPHYFRGTGHALKKLIDQANGGIVDSGGEQLIFSSAFEPAKLNIGDYTEMKNIGGQFPIGEVFTEARDLEAVNGRVRIFAFGDTSYQVNVVDEPIILTIRKGRVIDAIHSTPEFDQVLANIRADEGEVWMRELGFGMNRAFTKNKIVNDVGTYERMCGIHISLGAKHGVYKKANIRRLDAWHHVDVFVATEAVYLDDKSIYFDESWKI